MLKNKDGRTPRDLTTNDSIKNLLKEAEEKQLKKLNEEKSELTQNNTEGDNKDTKHLLGKTEPTSAAKKGVFAGGVVVALGTAAAVALFATGAIAVELVPILIAVVAVTVAALAVGGVTYMLSEPSVEQVVGNERKV
ncbi:ankyrin repeat-containing protein [Wolbachia endosymbiont of Cimex lectularius]|nr:ankyrin repeat-containing protein [Wolbachia endosymbiont of Cimex lectularius]